MERIADEQQLPRRASPHLCPMKLRTWMVMACFAGTIATMSLGSCKHGCKDGHASLHSGTESHNMGLNCQDCHHDDGEGEVCWQVCGTAYDSISGNTMADVTVRLWTELGDSGQLTRQTKKAQSGRRTSQSCDLARSAPANVRTFVPTASRPRQKDSRTAQYLQGYLYKGCYKITMALKTQVSTPRQDRVPLGKPPSLVQSTYRAGQQVYPHLETDRSVSNKTR